MPFFLASELIRSIETVRGCAGADLRSAPGTPICPYSACGNYSATLSGVIFT